MSRGKKIDFQRINDFALSSFESLLRQWLPDGRKNGSEWVSVNPTRADGHAGSFSVHIFNGVWKDFASGDGGSDPISLFAYLFHSGNQGAAAKELCALFGLDVEPNKILPFVDKKPRSAWVAIRPPVDCAAPHVAHIKRGRPERVWCYRAADGAVLGYVYRFVTSDGGKEVLPLAWCRNERTFNEEWRWMSFPEPRWLYGLDRLAARPDAPVLVVEGEKCAELAAEHLPDLVAVTWPGGGNSVHKVDWSPLAGRSVVIWPDCDAQRSKAGELLPAEVQPGIKAAHKIAPALVALGCKVWVMELPEPGEKKNGWDIADAVDEGLIGSELAAFVRGKARVYAQAGVGGATKLHPEPVPASAEAVPYREAWQDGLIQKPRGGIEDCRENVFLVLSRHPAWEGVIGWNDFTKRIEKIKLPPWGGRLGEWETRDDLDLGLWLAQKCDLLIRSEASLVAGVSMAADRNSFHPPREWLEGLAAWDGVNRLEHYVSDCVGCDNTRYVQLVGKYFLIGMVARIFRPGCPMQYMPVLEGAQGIGKSSFWRALGGEWFQETPFKLGDKDAYMQLNGAILYEIAEMDSFNKSESTQVKAFISQQIDRYREPYARRTVDRPRQCVFAGTTNHGEYLKDTTGNRRFWPIKATSVDIDALLAIRDQLFAEAFYRFKSGEQWYPSREDEAAHFVPQQDERRIVDPWLYPLMEWLEDVNQRMTREFTITDLLMGACKVELNKIDGNRGMATRMGNLMTELPGWQRKRRSTGFREWVWVRPESGKAEF